MVEYIDIKKENPKEDGMYELLFLSNENKLFKDVVMLKDGVFYDANPDWGLEKISYGKDILDLTPSIKSVKWRKIGDIRSDEDAI